jgi:hypothetical protein
MAITETLKNLLGKVLTIGTPSKKEVLYKEVIKRKAPKESAEKLVMDDIKNSFKKVFSVQKDVEFARGTVNPPVKKVAKKKTTSKKAVTKKKSTTVKKTATTSPTKKKTTLTKKSTTKKSSDEKAPLKKAVAKKTITKKVADKKESTIKKIVSKKAITKKPITKKATTLKTKTTQKAISTTKKKTPVSSKNVEKKVAVEKKTPNTKKSAAAPRGAKKAEKIALYIKDIKKHYGEVDEAFVAIIVKNLGPSIYKRDAELVSCSDPKELDTVRRNFLMKKLDIQASQAVLDAAIQDVCEELKGVRTKYRATFYYSLAKKFKKESVLK